MSILLYALFNTLRPRRNRRYFANDIFKYIFVNEHVWISIKISLEFIPKGPINNYPSLVQIMAWCRPGDKPLSGPTMVRSLTHICVTRPQWVNSLRPRKMNWHFDVIIMIYYIILLIYYQWCYMASPSHKDLTHFGLATPYSDIELGQPWLR